MSVLITHTTVGNSDEGFRPSIQCNGFADRYYVFVPDKLMTEDAAEIISLHCYKAITYAIQKVLEEHQFKVVPGK